MIRTSSKPNYLPVNLWNCDCVSWHRELLTEISLHFYRHHSFFWSVVPARLGKNGRPAGCREPVGRSTWLGKNLLDQIDEEITSMIHQTIEDQFMLNMNL